MNDLPAPTPPLTPGALQGIRVLDLSRVLAGPWCTQTLADLGAEVIKVERPRSDKHPGGDDTRGWGPPFLKDTQGKDTAEAAYFLGANRNKRSITVDIAHPAGQALIRRMAADCDVLIENYKVGDMARYGLDAASLRAACPRLVYCSITGFGQTGPYRQRAGYDSIFQGMGGLMAITGHADGEPGGGPQKVGLIVSDLMAGMYASVAILAALEHRDAVSGEGQTIDLALLDAQVAALSHAAMGYLVSGEPVPRCGTKSPTAAPSQMYRTEDGAIMLVVGNQAQWEKLAGVVGRPELPADPRFATNSQRIAHRDELNAILEPIFGAQPKQHWIDAFAAAGIPCGPVNELHEVFADPQVQARELLVHLPHPARAAMPMLANPIRLSGTPVQYRLRPPDLGQHTDEVLAELPGYDAARRRALREAGVI